MKVRDLLEKQLETKYGDDAKECIAVYDKLKEMNGTVWQSQWACLTCIFMVDKKPYYQLNQIGKYFLKGIQK